VTPDDSSHRVLQPQHDTLPTHLLTHLIRRKELGQWNMGYTMLMMIFLTITFTFTFVYSLFILFFFSHGHGYAVRFRVFIFIFFLAGAGAGVTHNGCSFSRRWNLEGRRLDGMERNRKKFWGSGVLSIDFSFFSFFSRL